MRNFDIDYVDKFSFFHTFKIYYDTTFEDIKYAACEFWGIKCSEEMCLTDEYFNILSTYKDTLRNFFSNA